MSSTWRWGQEYGPSSSPRSSPSPSSSGTDLSAIQPDRPDVPNCVFQRDDAEDTWVFPAAHPPDAGCAGPCEHRIMFDHVHLRLVSICFDDPRDVMRHAWDNMSPGGSAFQRWCKGCIDGAASIDRDILVPEKYKPWLEEIGCHPTTVVHIQARPLIWPDNPWPKDKKLKEVGLLELKNLLAGPRGMSYKLLAHAGYSPEDIETLVKESHDYLRDCSNRPYGIL
ncbi:hypothetical protein LQW54_009456 [Pestalotiopsis sp. IQ-011]